MTYNGEAAQSEKITSFTQLRTWQQARELAVSIYKITDTFPAAEKFGLTSQLRRASVSVAANIAEGFSRNGMKDKVQFYSIALGSLTETLSHVYIAHDLGFAKSTDLQQTEGRAADLHKMINGLMKSAQRRAP